MYIGVTESKRMRGEQTDHSTEKGDNHQYFQDFICFVHHFKDKMSLSC